ncbi:MAG TPA: response regulator [Azospirillum sp.]
MPKSILIVDDSRFARLSLRRIVEQHFPDWTVAEAANGVEALGILGDMTADYILLDYNMPGDDGLTVAEKMRAAGCTAAITLVTANVQDALSDRARQRGLSFLRKPAKEEQILALLGAG